VAPPREVYDRPANAFVAGFVGNPPMNLFAVRPAGDGVLAVGDQSFRAAAGPQARTAGIRPEAVALAGPDDAGTLRAVVEHVESLGHESLVHARIDGSAGGDPIRLVARVEGMSVVAPGDPVGLRIDPARVHLFAEDGRALASV
jgi:ABC-type sugar transport system ATPase subunit